MADTTKAAPAPEAAAAPKRSLSKASESTDPVVHRLLALRYMAEPSMNDEPETVKAVSAQLAELGYE